MAEYLAAKGARLALVDLNPEKLELAVAACQAQGVEARAYLCNVADEEQVTLTVTQIAEDFGAINGLINNGADTITDFSTAQGDKLVFTGISSLSSLGATWNAGTKVMGFTNGSQLTLTGVTISGSVADWLAANAVII